MTTQTQVNNAISVTPLGLAIAKWDTNSNHSANNHINGYATTVTAAGTTVLTVASAYQQYFTGTTTQTVTLPVASTLVEGQSFLIVNNSSGAVTVNSSGGNAVQVMAGGTTLLVTCVLNSGTTAASWNGTYAFDGGDGSGTVNSGTANQLAYYATSGTAVSGLTTTSSAFLIASASGVLTWDTNLPVNKLATPQIFTSGTNTYTPTTNMIFCDTYLVGPGGGGAGATSTSTTAGAGGGGGAGGVCIKRYTAANIGSTATVVLGTAGAGGTAGNNGSNGSANSTFTCTGTGATLTAGLGSGGVFGSSVGTAYVAGGAGGTATNGDINIPGQPGGSGIHSVTGGTLGGPGGNSGWGFGLGGLGIGTASSAAGGNATGFGAGGGGAGTNGATNASGGNGSGPYCIVYDYCSI